MKYIFLFLFFLYGFGSIAQTKKVDSVEDNPKNEVEEIEQKAVEEIEEKAVEEKPAFEFAKATVQKFNSGVPGAGSTTMLTVFLNKLTNENLEFSKIWIANDKPYYQLQLKRKFQADNWGNYKADDEVILFATSRNNNPVTESEKVKTIKEKMPPYQFNGDALIEYAFNNKLMYFEIPSLEQLQDINAQ